MLKLSDVIYKYRNYIRVLLYSVIVFLTLNLFTFSRKKDPELMFFFNKNLGIIEKYCNNTQYKYPFMTSVVFGKMDVPNAVAYCEAKLNGYKLVFDKRYWQTLSDLNKTQLMFHEMLHCMFDEDHSENPKHFMSPIMTDVDVLSLIIQVHNYLSLKCGPLNG